MAVHHHRTVVEHHIGVLRSEGPQDHTGEPLEHQLHKEEVGEDTVEELVFLHKVVHSAVVDADTAACLLVHVVVGMEEMVGH